MGNVVEQEQGEKKGKKKQKQAKVRTKRDVTRTEVSKAIRQLRNTLTAKALTRANGNASWRQDRTQRIVQKVIERAHQHKSEIRRRAPAVAQKLDMASSMKRAG